MESKRVGLKEIAELSGMSVGNVSMVLRGLGDSARISKAGQQRILEAARKLNYRPNVYAKRLRMHETDRPIIALFFAPTPHAAVIGSFFAGIHDLMAESGTNQPEIMLYPYSQGHLSEIDDRIHETFFNGAIFMGMSGEDMNYLEQLEIGAPVVLFNRRSARHHYVYTDNASIGRIAARIFAKLDRRRPCLVSGRQLSTAGKERRMGFVEECAHLSLPLEEEMQLAVSPRFDGGKEAVQMILGMERRPDAVFFSEDLMAVSALYEFALAGIRVPEEMSILCYNGRSTENYTSPSLSNIQLPMEEMSRDCLVLMNRAIQHHEAGQLRIEHKPVLILRSSTQTMAEGGENASEGKDGPEASFLL